MLDKHNRLTVFSGLILLVVGLQNALENGGSASLGQVIGLAGLAIATFSLVWPVLMRRRTCYTLTDRRAIISIKTLMGEPDVQTYPITPATELISDQGQPRSVYFAQAKSIFGRSRDIGFERLSDPEHVIALMTEVRNKVSAE